MQNNFDLSGRLCFVFSNFHFLDYPLLIQLAIVVSLIALCLIIVTLTVIFVNRIKKQSELETANSAEIIILDELNEHILMYDSTDDMPEVELDATVKNLESIKNRSMIFKMVLVKLLIYFKHNLTGNISRVITSTYFKLKLNETTLSKLKSSLWFNKAQGLKELQDINYEDAETYIEPLLNSNNLDVRVEAYAALLKLQSPLAFSLFEREEEELSNWHQILIFNAITKTDYADLPDFGTYLSNQNHSLIHLAIKLLLHYKQFNAIPQLINLLNNSDEDLRNQAICALGELDAEEAEQKLISIYPTEHNRNKSQILLAIGGIASGNALDFLRDKFLKADHYSILKSATAAIMSHPIVLRDEVLRRLNNLDEEQKAVIKHFEDPLIKLHGIR